MAGLIASTWPRRRGKSANGSSENQLAIAGFRRSHDLSLAYAAADRISALGSHARCRNAMRHRHLCSVWANAYLLKAFTGSCRSGAKNLFSGIDPLDELVGGIRFVA